MIFTAITIENFFSFVGETTIPLVDEGLVLLSGENGAGKSSVLEAIVWGLWGKTVRGYSGDAVINKNSTSCFVSVHFTDQNGINYGVYRYRGHPLHKNSLYLYQLNPERIDISEGTSTLTQEKVTTLLGIGFDTFIRGPMMPQGTFKRFSQMTDAEQKAVLEEALQLDMLSRAYQVTKQRLGDAERELAQLQTRTVAAVTSLEQHRQTLAMLRTSAEQQRFNQARARATALQHLMGSILEYDECWDQLEADPAEEVQEASEILDKLFVLAGQDAHQALSELQDTQTIHVRVVERMDCMHRDRLQLINKINSWKLLSTEVPCPTCGQPVSEQIRAERVTAAEARLNQYDTQILEFQTQIETLANAIQVLRSKQQERLDRSQQFIATAQEKLTRAQEHATSYKVNTIQLNRLDQELLRAPRPTYAAEQSLAEAIAQSEQFIEELHGQLEEMRSAVPGLTQQIAHLNFWRTGFSNGGLKSKILASATPHLNKLAARYAQELTNGELKITFSTQTTLKSGEERERFNVEVVNKHGALTYDGSSGGERARADLAINLTLSDLVASRSQKPYPQRWYDEPFEALDEAGIEAVMALLVKLVPSCGSVFVVTHQPHFQALFNKVLTVKKENGITVLR